MAKTKEESTALVMNPATGEMVDPSVLFNMEGFEGEGLGQDFEKDDLIIPRITILQDLSPQVKERKAEFVEGAKVGMIYNSINNALDAKLMFIPAHYHAPWVAWKPRPDGGLVDNDVDPAILTEAEGFFEDGIDRFTGHMSPFGTDADKVKVEVIKTPTWVGIAVGENGWTMPVAISFPATKSKAARKINTAINLCKRKRSNGDGTFRPPGFAHTFELGTAIEQAGENEWFGYTVNHVSAANDQSTDPIVTQALAEAIELARAFASGEARVADATETDR